jgi:ribonucleotide monophosphatase NagD (HAD superfamily)
MWWSSVAAARRARGADTTASRVLAIGDSIRTDLKGAVEFGIDCLFVTAGIHAEELGGRDNPSTTALAAIFADAGIVPKLVMRQLAW